MAFVVRRIIYVDFRVCRKKKILEYVEKKNKVQGIKWGGLLPISIFVSRHCSSVATRRVRCARQARLCARPRTCERVRADVPREACRDIPPWVLYRDREFSVAIELAHPVSRQGFLVLRQGVGLLGLLVSRQWRFSVSLKYVAIELSLSW